MEHIIIQAQSAIDEFNTHNETDLTIFDLLDPFIETHSIFDSFDDLLHAAVEDLSEEASESSHDNDNEENDSHIELTTEAFDEFINNHFEHPVSCFHSLMTQAMNYHND